MLNRATPRELRWSGLVPHRIVSGLHQTPLTADKRFAVRRIRLQRGLVTVAVVERPLWICVSMIRSFV